MTTYSDEAMRRVQHGVAWLDRNRPDWPSRVTLPEFDIENTCDCVIGQVFAPEAEDRNTGKTFKLYSGWSVGMLVAVDSGDADQDHVDTFAITRGFDSGDDNVSFEELQAAWTEVIAERQRAIAEV